MIELLAPAGSFESLVAAISNGADAVYLGLNRFGARAYANNFTLEELEKAVEYAHIRNVKVYVTMNTIVYDSELAEAYSLLNSIYRIGVDGVIVQDLALLTYITERYPLMEVHCSTQMGVDDLNGVLFFKKLNAKRVVLSREVPVEEIKTIKKLSKMPIELFVHGALCVSYSGNCLMSGLIGYRSGNRGRCVGSCRKPYTLINSTQNETLSKSYILSMKDLKTIERISELAFADSLKIEGRMKEPEYVANIVSSYRNALNHSLSKNDIEKLHKTFHRTFTKGYIFKEDKKDITNIIKPNNFGYPVGKITKKTKIGYEIQLTKPLNQFDTIRIDHNMEDVNITLTKLYDAQDNFIPTASKICYIKIKEDLSIGDIVYKTKDIQFYESLQPTLKREYRRFPLTLHIYGSVGYPLYITIECEKNSIEIESNFLLEQATNHPTTQEQFFKQFNRLNDTIYELNIANYEVENIFIPSTKINELRRIIVQKMDEKRNPKRSNLSLKEETYLPLHFEQKSPELAVYCTTLEQYETAKQMNIKTIYYKDNIIRRNLATYPPKTGELLIGGYGGIYAYQNTNPFVTDYSLNVVNYKSVYLLHQQGAKRVTLSYEINQKQIQELIETYVSYVGGYPNLELIVYGRAPMMFTKYCPLKVVNQCGKCKENQYILKDEYGYFPILSYEDCTTTILNGKVLNLIDDILHIKHVQTFRIQLTTESKEESKLIIEQFQNRLMHQDKSSLFNKETDTRGHFNKEIL